MNKINKQSCKILSQRQYDNSHNDNFKEAIITNYSQNALLILTMKQIRFIKRNKKNFPSPTYYKLINKKHYLMFFHNPTPRYFKISRQRPSQLYL